MGLATVIVRHLLREYVKFPSTPEEQNGIKQGFYEKWGCRGVVGAIDGTQVEIISPPIADEEHPPFVYINRKGKHSINVMLICDSNCKILACSARFPGSVHDSAIWQMGSIRRFLKQKYENGDRQSHLIGDSGYPLEQWLFTPIGNTIENTPEARFDAELTSARNVIERTNGILKGRFRCLLRHRTLLYHPTRAANIIYAGCVLHNIALNAGLILPNDEIEYRDPDNIFHNNGEVIEGNEVYNLGRAARAAYIRNYL